MMLSTLLVASEGVARTYEPGWDWWAWPIAWLVFLACGIFMGLAMPAAFVIVEATDRTVLRVAGLVVLAGVELTALAGAFAGSGWMMRHCETSSGARWVFVGSLVVGLVSWFVAARVIGNPSWYVRVPVVVIIGGALVGGVTDWIARTAASIPMGVGQFTALMVALVIGAVIYILGNSRDR